MLDPTDLVLQQHPRLAEYNGLALPNVNCSESALRLALAVSMMPKEAALEDFDPATIAPPLMVGMRNAATPNEMVRRLERMQIRGFPTYMLVPPGAGPGVEFVLLDPERMKPREDQWAIVYLPQEGAFQPHWTFTTVAHQERKTTVEGPIMIYTPMPITDPSELVYWRARPTAYNMQEYVKRRARGLACHCCQALPCPHEIAWKWRHPNTMTLTFDEDLAFDGEWRAQLRQATKMDGHATYMGSGGVVTLVTPDGQETKKPRLCDHPAVLRLTREVGAWHLPEFYAFWGNEWGGAAIAETYAKRLARWIITRVGNTMEEVFWPFYYWKYDIPRDIRDITIRPYHLRCYQLEHRRIGPAGLIGLAALNVVRCTVRTGAAALLWKAGLSDQWAHVPVLAAIYAAWYGIGDVLRTVACFASIPLATILSHFPTRCRVQKMDRGFGALQGTQMAGPEAEETTARLAVRTVRTKEIALDMLRRAMNQTQWARSVHPEEVQLWLETVVNTPANTVVVSGPTNDKCITCWRVKAKKWRGECRDCRKRRESLAPEPVLSEPVVTYIGRLGLWSRQFTLPNFTLKDDVKIYAGSRRYPISHEDFIHRIHLFAPETSCRGWNSGPQICSNTPQCFPRGTETACKAFCVRLGVKRLHKAQEWVYRLWYESIVPFAYELQPETRDEFLAHFSGKDREKMREALDNIDAGYPANIGHEEPIAKLKGFTKAENSFSYEQDGWNCFVQKPTEKPRFICCPSPEFLAEIGPYTHPQLKWMAKEFGPSEHLFYAGCATPDEMNEWLNRTLHEIPDPVSLVDDITAIDSNHSHESFIGHERLRRLHYPRMPLRVAKLYQAEEHIRVRVDKYILEVCDVNASGVSDTSYKNGIICLFIRVWAIVYAVTPTFTEMTVEEQLERFRSVSQQVYTSAAGDDGLTRMPRWIDGVDTKSARFLSRYCEYWALAGFSVKAQVIPEHRWRMATYLAMRPVWAGKRYEWAPEPARRLRKLYWQIDNFMHPVAWARGVSSQVLGMSRHLPVLSHVCEWYLAITEGATATCGFDPQPKRKPRAKRRAFDGNPVNLWDNYVSNGKRNDRATAEFCADYHVDPEEISFLERQLAQVKTPWVNLSTSVLMKVMCEES